MAGPGSRAPTCSDAEIASIEGDQMRHVILAVLITLLCGVGMSAGLEPGVMDLYPIVDPILTSEMPTEHSTVLGQHSIELNWSYYQDPTCASYLLSYRLPDGGEEQNIQLFDPTLSSRTVDGLNLGTEYEFRITALSASRQTLALSQWQRGGTRANDYPFSDGMEGVLDAWDLLNTDWDTTSSWAHGGSISWTDSPDENYPNLASLDLVTSINLMTALKPVLEFWHYYNIQTDGDFGYLEVSEDGGANWTRVYAITGSSGAWLRERIDLSPYRGNVNLKIRWQLSTNATGVSDGWYVDDVSIGETPYATIALPLHDDVNDAVHSDSLWFNSSWATVPGGVGGGYYFTDSPNGDFADYLSTKMTSVADLDLSSATNPWILFQHRLDLDFQNEARVEVSIDGGANWTVVKEWVGPATVSEWTRVHVDLSEYAGGDLRTRFHLINLGVDSGDGWDIDEINLADLPESLTLSLDVNHYNYVDLSWTEFAGGGFDSYEIYRDTAPDFVLGGDLLATFNGVGETEYSESVDPAETYYYQVFVRHTEGSYLAQSNVVERLPFELPLLSYPFFDDMESGDINFQPESPWALTEESAYSGTHSWSDSPSGNYANNTNSSLVFHVDLAGGSSNRPELSFQQLYGFEEATDYGYVDVSIDGGSTFNPIYYVSGSGGGWNPASVDLTDYRNQVLILRFRVSTSASGQADGWHIDDIKVAENTDAVPTFEFVDNFNDSLDTHGWWIPGPFKWVEPSGNGSRYWSNRVAGIANFYPSTSMMILGRSMDLSSAVNPQIFLRYRSYFSSYNSANSYLQISTDEGDTWTSLFTFTSEASWTDQQLDISAYAGSGSALFRFLCYDGDPGANNPWLDLEDFSVSDLPQDVTLSLSDEQDYQCTISWTENVEGDFDRYVVKRSTSTPVTLASETIAEIHTAGTSSHDDTDISPYDVFYYRVFVYDELGVVSTGSNEVLREAIELPTLAYPFYDDMESGSGNFLAELPWSLSNEMAYSGAFSWSDSPGELYANSIDLSFVMQIDLSAGEAVRPELSFRHHYGLETNADWGQVDASTDGGLNFQPIYYMSGSSGEWRETRIDLTEYRGTTLQLRFRISTNASGQADGWHIDDISVDECSTVALAYPFVDAFEDSAQSHSDWLMGAFAWSSPSDDGSHYFSNRSTGSSANFYPGHTIMSLGAPLNFGGAVEPQLYMKFRSYDSSYNSAETYLQISSNGGETWGTLQHLPSTSNWASTQLDLESYEGQENVLLRVYSYDGDGGATNPWMDFDDFVVKNQPEDVTLSLTENQAYQCTLDWTASVDPTFDRYVVKRSATTPVTLANTTLAEIDVAGTTTFTDEGLSPYDVYYYKIFTYDELGLYSDGSNEVMREGLEPPLLSYPFFDDMEAGSGNFLADTPWAISDESSHSGDWSWTDSPGGNYENNVVSSLAMRVDLSGGVATHPELSFMEQYGFETNSDWGFVDVSTDGGDSWIPIYFITGNNGGWTKARIDLVDYRGQVLYLRFRMSTGPSGQADGWHVDDIRLDENDPLPAIYPFVDAFDDSASTHNNWLPSAFKWTSPSDDGTPYWSNMATGSTGNSYPGFAGLAMASYLDFSEADEPQARMRYRAYNSSYNSAETYLRVSQDDGLTWPTVYQFPSNGDWTDLQLDLSSYAGPEPVLLRFYSYDGDSGGSNPWFEVENFSVSDQPDDVILSIADNQPYEVTLEWTPSEEANFDRYVLMRSATTPVTLSSTTLATIEAIEDTTFTDTGLDPDEIFYYKVFTFDDLDLYSDGSNEVQRGMSELPLLAYPFFDDMEMGGGNFVPELPWTLTDETAFSGDYSWSDSPYGNYENSVNKSLNLRIDMGGAGAVRPVLSFMHRYGFETNADWGFVDISTDGGSNYTTIYYLTGSKGEWSEAEIDLTDYRGQVAILRFRLNTGASGQADGWHIDDIQIAESPVTIIHYPFVDSGDEEPFSEDIWISGAFARTTPSGDGSYYWSNRPTGEDPDFNGSNVAMVLGGSMDLSSALSPELRLEYRAYDSSYNSTETHIQISQDNGNTWGNLFRLSNTSTWTQQSLGLSSYVGPAPIILRIYSTDRSGSGTEPWCNIDNLALLPDPNSVDQIDWCELLQPDRIWLTVGQTSAGITAQVFEEGLTDAEGQGAGILAQVGSAQAGSHPRNMPDDWSWATATYAGDSDDDSMDLYSGTLTGGAVGDYDYAFRFSLDGGESWVFADLDGSDVGSGGFNYYKSAQSGELVVTLEPELIISETSIELTLPAGQATSRAITIGNDGIGPLIYVAQESETPPDATEITWLGVSPLSDTLAPNEFSEIVVSLDATNLEAGEIYAAYVVLFTNDPDHTEIDIPVTVNVVSPSAPHLSGTVLDVAQQSMDETVFIEVYDGASLVAETTAGSDGYYIIFGIPEGSYEVRAFSDGYYPEELPSDFPASDVNFTLHRVPWFTPTNTNVNFYGASSLLDGLPLAAGDVVTVQDPAGILCGAYYVRVSGHYGFLHAYGDDVTTPDVDEGAEPGDTMEFRINGQPALALGPDDPIWASDGDLRNVELSGVSTDQDLLYLDAGWNLISFNRMAVNDSVPNILAELIDEGNLVILSSFDQSWGGALTYDPANPEFSDLWFMDPEHGYWLKTLVEDTLTVTGESFWPDNPLALEAYWNLVSYLPEESREVERALASIDGLYELVSGFDGGALTYVPGEDPFNTLDVLSNGFGYWIKMLYPADLSYNFVPGAFRDFPAWDPAREFAGGDRDFATTPWWDSFFGEVRVNGNPLPQGEVLDAYDPDGVLCGQFTVDSEGFYGFMPVYGDDPNTEADEGAEIDDIISIHWDGHVIAVAPAEMAWQGSQILHRMDIDGIVTAIDEEALPQITRLHRAYPNPFNPKTTIRYELAKDTQVSLRIFDASGRMVSVLVNGREDAGRKEVNWMGRDDAGRPLPSGIYFYRFEADGIVESQKMLLLK